MRLATPINSVRSLNPAAAARLAWLFSDISDRFYAAGWLQRIEYDLWYLIHQPPPWRIGFSQLSTVDVIEICLLAEACGGWIIWHDEFHYEMWIPLAEWEARYRADQERNALAAELEQDLT
jgi:hypothetical protein